MSLVCRHAAEGSTISMLTLPSRNYLVAGSRLKIRILLNPSLSPAHLHDASNKAYALVHCTPAKDYTPPNVE
eukprot:scaffold554884_cov16-Prasinocladus_malaysianus.AAC.1